MIVTSGGIGGNHDLVRANWPERLGTPPGQMLSGVPAHVDGLMLGIAEDAGARLINRDRMWHYTEGIENWNPIWDQHGIRILPGPSSLWLDARGKRLPVPLFPGFDTLGTLDHIMQHRLRLHLVRAQPADHRQGVHPQRLRAEPRPDRASRCAASSTGRVPTCRRPVKAFMDHGADFVVEKDLAGPGARHERAHRGSR